MSNPNYKGRALLPLSVIEAARAGDAEAVEEVLRYYEGYINKLCTRTLYVETVMLLSRQLREGSIRMSNRLEGEGRSQC